MQCEMCGAESALRPVMIEGVRMSVCSKCSRYGKSIIRENKPIIKEQARYRPKEPEYVEELVPDYSTIIKSAVQKIDMQEDALAKRIGMKESVLKAYMKGSLKPSIDDARILEKFFSIRIVERIKESSNTVSSAGHKSADLTIGDMIRVRKRS